MITNVKSDELLFGKSLATKVKHFKIDDKKSLNIKLTNVKYKTAKKLLKPAKENITCVFFKTKPNFRFEYKNQQWLKQNKQQ